MIEFAICMPILIIMLFYINDLVKIKRYYSQTEFVAQQMANILQNLAKKRADEGTTISCNDLRYAASFAFLTLYPGTSQYSPNGQWKHELKHIPCFCIHYVTGTSEGNAKCLWGIWCRSGKAKRPPWNALQEVKNNISYSNINYNSSETSTSNIYPTLKIESGKSKIILEVFMYWDKGTSDLNGNNVSTAREAFGCRLSNVISPTAKKNYPYLFFPSVTIFTPNKGFPETKPN